MTDKRQQPDAEETIVPIGRSRPQPQLESVQGSAAITDRRPLVAGAAVLVLLLVIVFIFLPGWVEERNEPVAEAEPAAPTDTPAEVVVPVLTAEELAALEAHAETLLADLLQQQSELDARSAVSWGDAAWVDYQEQSRLGDTAFLADGFQAASDYYTRALELGSNMLARSEEIMASALAAGDSAVQAGDSVLAIEQYEIVLGVEPENARAVAGKTRAENLPQVLELVRSGDTLRQEQDLSAAAERYREALAIDPQWLPAENALRDVTVSLVNSRFDNLLSRGFAALSREEYDDAADAFREALAMRAGSTVAQEGLEQSEQGKKLDAIALSEIRALAFERRELWDQAIERYEAALATDPTLAFAIAGLERSRARADLNGKLENLINNANLLLTDSVLADAERLLEDARPLAGPESLLSEQVVRLEALVTAASTPITVQLKSDAMTEVTVYRVGPLGLFEATELELRPGTYTVVGSRKGYRDVRETFTVLPGRRIEPVSIVCAEPI